MQTRLRSNKPMFGLLFCLPAFLVMAFVLVYPLAYSVDLSLRRDILVEPNLGTPFVGFANYIRIFHDQTFYVAWQNTVLFVGGGVGGAFLVGLSLALMLNQLSRGKAFFRSVFLFPYVMPTTGLALLWMWMFNGSYGIVNYLLSQVGITYEFRSWFADPRLAMVPLIGLFVWRGAPFHMLMLLAGMQSIPSDLYEAAKVDGASAIMRFRFVTIPMLRHVIAVVLLLSVMYAMQFFTPIWLLTRGGPGSSTLTLSVYVYRLAFQQYDFGMSSAVGAVWLVVVAIITGLVIRAGSQVD